jgi:hypothetical protein
VVYWADTAGYAWVGMDSTGEVVQEYGGLF